MAKALTKEIIIKDVLQVINKYNCSKYKTYKQHGKHSEATIIKYFGNWSNLLEVINIKPIHRRNISKEDILQDITKVFNTTNNTTRENYLKYGSYSRAPIIRLFGSWNNVLSELNMDININKNITKEEVLEDILKHIAQYPNITALEYRKIGKYSQSVIDRIFGSWTNLKKQLDLPIDKRFISDEEIFQNVKELYNEYGFISTSILDNECIVSRQTLVNRYGSIKKLLTILNINNSCYNKQSKLQQYMLTFCENILGTEYELEKSFEWLKNDLTGRKLFIDIYYPNLNIAIEVDGEQHYARNKWKENLEQIQQRDQCKNRLLEEHDILLIRLKYNDSKQTIVNKLNALKK